MTATVRESLTLETFRECKILAGQEGLDREISGVTFIEAPDSWQWLRSGEFVITLAYAFQDEPQLLALVEALIEKKVACLCLKTDRFLKVVPPSVLALADEAKLPVVDLPNHVPFVDVIQPVQTLVLNGQAKLLSYAERVRHCFFNLSVEGAEIQQILETLRGLIQVDFAFLDGGGASYLLADSPRLGAILQSLELPQVLQKLPHEELSLKGQFLGHLIFEASTEKLSNRYCEVAINQAKGALLLYFQRRMAQMQVEARYRNEFVQDLLFHNVRMEQEVWSRAQAFGWNLQGPQRVLVADIDDYKSRLTQSIGQGRGALPLEQGKKRIYSMVKLFMARLGGPYPYTEMSDSIVYILPASQEAWARIHRELPATLDAMMEQIARDTGFTVTVGLGDGCESVFECHHSYSQARQSLELMRQHSGGNSVARWDQMGLYRLLSPLVETSQAKAFVEERLGEFLRWDQGRKEPFLDTLETVIDQGWNVKEAASALGIHYNTLKYRWKKICSQLAIDPQSSEDRLEIMVALKLWRLSQRGPWR